MVELYLQGRIMNGNWSRAIPVISAIISLIILALIVGGWFYSYGNLQARVDELARDQTEIRQEMRDGFDRVDADLKTLREEVRLTKEGFNRVDADLKALREELREDIRLTKEEIRVSRSEIIAAIQEHEHDDQGRVVFRRPY